MLLHRINAVGIALVIPGRVKSGYPGDDVTLCLPRDLQVLRNSGRSEIYSEPRPLPFICETGAFLSLTFFLRRPEIEPRFHMS